MHFKIIEKFQSDLKNDMFYGISNNTLMKQAIILGGALRFSYCVKLLENGWDVEICEKLSIPWDVS